MLSKMDKNDFKTPKNYLLDSNALAIFSPYGMDSYINNEEYKGLYEFIKGSLSRKKTQLYMTSFSYFEIIRGLKEDELASKLNNNLIKKVNILPTKFEVELYLIIMKYNNQMINYKTCMEKLLIEVRKKLSIMLYYFIYSYLLFHLNIKQLLEMKQNMNEKLETELIKKYSSYGENILSKEFEDELHSACETLVNQNYPDGNSKNEINGLILNTLKKLNLNGDYAKIINEKIIKRFNEKYPKAKYDFILIRHYLYEFYKILPFKNFETLNCYLIEKLTINNHMIEFNDFIDLYNVSFISNEITLITLDKRWIDFLDKNKLTINELENSSYICNELKI